MENLTLRICIIGAGPAGLSAAEALVELGFRNVTVLEKRNQVGGQALSGTYPTAAGGEIVYELGSVSPTSSPTLKKLIKRYGCEYGKPSNGSMLFVRRYSIKKRAFVFDTKKYFFGHPLTFKTFFKFMHDFFKIITPIIKYKKLFTGSFSDLDRKQYRELSIPYVQWIDNLHLVQYNNDLKFVLALAMTFANPQNNNQYPAMIALKLLDTFMRFPPRYTGRIKLLKGGYQDLWQRVAARHDVRLNTDIKHITRDNEITVEMADGQTLKFDKLIITCRPDQTHNFLDLTPEEKIMAENIGFSYGWRMLFSAKHLHMPGEVRTFLECIDIDDPNAPRLMVFYPEGQIDKDTWLFSAVVRDVPGDDMQQVKNNISMLLAEHFGAQDLEWIKQIRWEYGSYYNLKATQQNIYQLVESMQGKNNTFYLGATLGGHMHATVTEFSYRKVKEFCSEEKMQAGSRGQHHPTIGKSIM